MENTSIEIIGPENITKVDWKKDTTEGGIEAINHNLKLYQESLGLTNDNHEKHGYMPVSGEDYEGIIVPDAQPYLCVPKELSTEEETPEFAIALSEKFVISQADNPELSLSFSLEDDSMRGMRIRVIKRGEDDNDFHKSKIIDHDALKQSLSLSQSIGTTKSAREFANQLSAEQELMRQAVTHITKTAEFIKPAILDHEVINLAVGELQLTVRAIKDNLLFISTRDSFNIVAVDN